MANSHQWEYFLALVLRITLVSGDFYWSTSSLRDWHKQFFIKVLSMWKADPDRRRIMGKETNSTAQPPKYLRVPNLDQGGEIRVSTHMMWVHEHWLFSMYKCIFFSYSTKNVSMFSLTGIKNGKPIISLLFQSGIVIFRKCFAASLPNATFPNSVFMLSLIWYS